MTTDFGIKIDGEELVSEFASEQNEKFFTLFEWQKKAIDYFFSHDCKAIFEVTTGAGKSICTISILKKILEKDPGIYVLIVVPKNVILEKMWFPELMKHGFSMREIGTFYGQSKECNKITITNMQNIDALPLNIFNMIILDEIHNYGTPRLLKILNYPFKYKLGLSATLERSDKNHWDLLSFFNYHLFRYTPKEAIDDGVINDFNFYNIGVNMEKEDYEIYLVMTQKINACIQQGGSFHRIMSGKCGIPLRNQLLKLIGERKMLVLNYPKKFEALKKIIHKHPIGKILVFNQYNIQTSKIYWVLLEDKIRARVLHSGIPKDEREQILNDYIFNKFNVLLVTMCLDEGANISAIDVGIIMAGNTTAKQTIQRMGRVLRKKEDRSFLYQIYVRSTMEEDQGKQRARVFEELCSEYHEMNFTDGELVEI